MADQAEALRRLVRQVGTPVEGVKGRVVVVIGAQPAVGASTVSRNLALAFQRQGWPAALVDADLDDPNLLAAWEVPPRSSVADLTTGRRTVREVLQSGPGGLQLIGGVRRTDEAVHVPGAGKALADALCRLAQHRSVVVDVGRGDVWSELYQLASVLLVVTTSERMSLHAAYAWMKQIAARRTAAQIWLIHNRVQDLAVARHAQQRLVLAADRFLNLDISLAGLLPGEQKRSYTAEAPSCGLLLSSTGSFHQTLERLVVRWMGDERKRWPAIATVGEKSEKTESTKGAEPITSPSLFAPTVVKM